jgi:glycosyltransferase involved in cell wall biosynthesis
MDDVTVVVGTFGEPAWVELAQQAIRSAHHQAPVIHVHAGTLAEARNACLEQVETEWVIHLDADDELEPGYVAAMRRGSADIRAPRVRCMRGGHSVRHGLFMPRVWRHRHACDRTCLPHGSWVVVGAAVRADLVRAVGGWQEEPIYEDWSLWLRCYKAGATFEAIHGAIYRQHLRVDSRNHAGPAWERRDFWHHEILRSVLPDGA